MNISVRSCINADLDEVTHIELRSSDYPLEYDDFKSSLSNKSFVGLVADCDDKILGYLLYSKKGGTYQLVSMAVHPEFRRQGVATAMLKGLLVRTSGLYPIEVVVSDRNLPFHCLLRKIGFVATKVISDYFGPMHDGYEFTVGKNGKIKKTRKKL